MPLVASPAQAQESCEPLAQYPVGKTQVVLSSTQTSVEEQGGDGALGHWDGGNGGGASEGAAIALLNCDSITSGLSAKSNGGKGGDGRGAAAPVTPGIGARGGDGGIVFVENLSNGTVKTAGVGLFGSSVGGNGGNGGGADTFGSGADGGIGGNGSDVTIVNAGTVSTTGDKAQGLYGLSVGGEAGLGGSGGWFNAHGGSGGAGGNSGSDVIGNNSGTITTSGDGSSGMSLHSIGGAGGEGGSTSKGFYAVGGNGGAGGDGGQVDITNTGTIKTTGHNSKGVSGLSIGGGGGDGGSAFAAGLVAGVAIGGYGGHGGDAAAVTVNNTGQILTDDKGSVGINAQSIGGGGGNGGSAKAIAVGPNFAFTFAMGGSGGAAGDARDVTVNNAYMAPNSAGQMVRTAIPTGETAPSITTGATLPTLTALTSEGVLPGDYATGILAQSIGGGGGNGGNAFTAALSAGVDASLSLTTNFGGAAGGGGTSGAVSVISDGSILTSGRMADGIVAQSIGGGGGRGGSAHSVSGAGSEIGADVQVALAGHGGAGSKAGAVSVNSFGSVTTLGTNSTGIMAQSVGGGGGAGGNILDIGGAVGVNSLNVQVSLGGKGAGGGDASTASITTQSGSAITTYGEHAVGALVQSIGGGGGSGGSIHNYAVAGQADQGTAATVGVAIGGSGAVGGTAAEASLKHGGAITTWGSNSTGAMVQSIGGSGGNGGNVFAANLALSASTGENFSYGKAVNANVTIGGAAKAGADASTASYTSEAGSTITTNGLRSNGITVQSIGGGGGNGGQAHGFSVATAIPASFNELFERFKGNLVVFDDYNAPSSFSTTVSIGGKAGTGGLAGAAVATLSSDTTTTTHGHQSHGLLIQSIGGGGGSGGSAATTGYAGVGAKSFAINIGKNGGTGGNGNTVTVDGGDANGVASFVTTGDQAYGILAQSIGGSGGEGGSTETHLPSALPVQSKTTLGLGMASKGGDGNYAGNVSVTNVAATTSGVNATGVVAQSIGGGGGVANASSGNTVLDFVIGGGGSKGADGGTVSILGASAKTSGAASIGLHAQSIGGGGGNAGLADLTSAVSSITNDLNDLVNKMAMSLGSATGDGNGSAVTVGCSDAATNGYAACSTIDTGGVTSLGILAQSIGGTGGVIQVSGSKDAKTDFSAVYAAGAGSSGKVTVSDNNAASTFNVSTSNDGAIGIVAQSLDNSGGAILFDTARGDIAQSGSTPAALAASANGGVEIDLSGKISTTGSYAHGIYAQAMSGAWTSFGADGLDIVNRGSDNTATTSITVAENASITTGGSGSSGIYAHTASTAAGAIDIDLEGKITSGGFSAIHAVNLASSSDSTAANPAVKITIGANAVASVSNTDSDVIVVKTPGFAKFVLDGTLSNTGGAGLNITADHVDLTHSSTSVVKGHVNMNSTASDGVINSQFSGYIYGSTSFGGFTNANVTVDRGALLHAMDQGATALNLDSPYVADNGQIVNINGEVYSNTGTALSAVVDSSGQWANAQSTPSVGITVGDFGHVEAAGAGQTAINIHTGGSGTLDISGVVMASNNGTAVDMSAGTVDFTLHPNAHVGGDIRIGATQEHGGLNATIASTVIGDVVLFGNQGANTINTYSIQIGDFILHGRGGQSIVSLNSSMTGSVTIDGGGGYSKVTFGGTLVSTSGPAFTIDSNTDLTISGSVTGDIQGGDFPSWGTGSAPNGTVKFTQPYSGSVSGFLAMDLDNYQLNIAGSGPQPQTIDVWSVNPSASGLTPRLTSLPTPDYQPATITLQNPSLIYDADDTLNLKGTLVTSYGLVTNKYQGYDADQGNYYVKTPAVFTITPYIDFSRANLTGNLGSIATLADTQVKAAKGGSTTEDSALETLLVEAANATDVESLSNYLQVFDTTQQQSQTESGANDTSSSSESLHSCGGGVGASVDPVSQGNCVWAKVTYSQGYRHQSHKQSNIAFAMGRQVAIGDNLYFGLGATYDDSRFSNGGIQSNGTRLSVGGVLKYVSGPAFGAVSVLGSYGWADGTRTFAVPTMQGQRLTAYSDQKSWVVATRVRVGYLFDLGGLDLTAMADVDLPLIRDLGYTETGAGSFNLRTAATTQLLVDVHPRARFGKQFMLGTTSARLYGEVGHRFALNDVEAGVALANGFDSQYEAAVSYDREDGMMTYGIGAVLDLSDRVEARISYELADGDESRLERFSAKMAWKF